MTRVFSELRAVPLSTRVALELEQAIISGAIKPGELINVNSLARQFNVSHIPIREALKTLTALGLIVQDANKSARVLELREEDVKHIFEVRKALEGLAVSLAARSIDDRNKKKLQQLVDQMRRLAESKAFLELFKVDKKFHQVLWDLSGNPFLVKALSTLLMPYFAFLATRGYYAQIDDLSYVPRVHQEILDAVSSGDGASAQRILIQVHDQWLRLILKGNS